MFNFCSVFENTSLGTQTPWIIQMHPLFGDFLLHLLFIVCQCVHVDVLLHVVKLETVVVPYGERMRTFTKGLLSKSKNKILPTRSWTIGIGSWRFAQPRRCLESWSTESEEHYLPLHPNVEFDTQQKQQKQKPKFLLHKQTLIWTGAFISPFSGWTVKGM